MIAKHKKGRQMFGARLFSTAMLLGVSAVSAHAQVGIRGGVNLTKFVGGDAADYQSAQGLNLGMSVPLFRMGPLSLVPEVYYSQKGAKQSALLGAPTFALDLDYVEVPVLAKLSIPLRRSLSAYVAGGPAFAWNINCSFSIASAGDANLAGATPCGETFGSFNTAMDKADRGIVLSGGLDFVVPGVGGLNLDARLVRGLARLGTADNGGDLKNQSVTLMLGYYLGR